MTGSRSVCSSCGAAVVWIRTENDRPMICDPEPVVFVPDSGGRETLVTGSGKTYARCRTGELVDEQLDAGKRLRGLRPHWGSCPNAKEHRR